MDHTSLSHLTDRELLLHADNARDPLTTTDIEIEMTTRFERLVGLAEIEDAVGNVGIDVADIAARSSNAPTSSTTSLRTPATSSPASTPLQPKPSERESHVPYHRHHHQHRAA
jgi:hypothetical protein